ncbi:hypothetical protein [Rubellimicrobium aerolatum]|uniref:Uncharacterized protein n=1 Tax=Rubellimicrobium aerolatum TaxID=490979 RepID=A0ABW0SEX2_9RHOB|nr:hypothetical protein [Rubellimicrobium aerolatum]MBP1806472.1 hypothetical protein [Rubellimicrobium aerolatum]
MKIETQIEAVALASHVPPTPPKGRCPACGAVPGEGRDALAMACGAAEVGERLACLRRRAVARAERDRAAVEAVKARAAVPEVASPEIVAAPARGPMRVAPQAETVWTDAGPRARAVTRDGFHPVALADAFDVMTMQARRRDKDAAPPYTVAQVEAGREYARLRERCLSEGVRCTSVEALGQSGGSGQGSWIDGVIQRGERLDRMRAAIGRELALAPRRQAATVVRKEGGRVLAATNRATRELGRTITVADLVDAVCCEGLTLSALLQRRGWSARTESLAVLRAALCAALDRLYGL